MCHVPHEPIEWFCTLHPTGNETCSDPPFTKSLKVNKAISLFIQLCIYIWPMVLITLYGLFNRQWTCCLVWNVIRQSASSIDIRKQTIPVLTRHDILSVQWPIVHTYIYLVPWRLHSKWALVQSVSDAVSLSASSDMNHASTRVHVTISYASMLAHGKITRREQCQSTRSLSFSMCV
jgi:hypothetical protein